MIPGDSISKKNIEAWENRAYEAWVERFGEPDDAARRLLEKPGKGLDTLLPHFGEVAGKAIVNIMGSNGLKAIALALLGANVTVIDASAENARYAGEVAAAAGIKINYIVSDLLSLPLNHAFSGFDIAFAELGIVHYFTDLAPFFEVVRSLLVPGATLVLRDFHPISTKLLSYRGSTAKVRKYKVTGNYFDTSLEERPVAFEKHLGEEAGKEARKTVLLRRWTLGEIVTAVATAGFVIVRLDEEPNMSSDVFDAGIPKTFTLVAVL